MFQFLQIRHVLLPLIAAWLALAGPPDLFAQAPPNPPGTSSPPVADSASEVSLKSSVAPAGGNVWLDRLEQSGTTGIVQLLVSVFGAGYIIERFIHLRRAAIAPRGLAEQARNLWNEGKFAELEDLAAKEPSTLARAISFLAKRRHRHAADVTPIAADLVGREMDAHSQRAYPVGVVATLEPLLGLMGMVMGMIDSFEKVAVAGALGNPAQLAAGISEALTTTALGIGLAIPFLAFFHYFRNRTRNFEILLENEVAELSTEWFVDKEESHGSSQAA